MDKGTSASWEQVHRIFFPGGPVPASLINPTPNSGAGILGPGPAPTPFINLPSTSSPAPFGIQNSAPIQRVGIRPPPPPPPALHLDNGSRRKDDISHFGAPPPVPRDPKTSYYVKLLAALVSKFGREYETLVKGKQHGKPEFGFLYGGHPGSDAGLGNRYYEWQKDVLLKVSETKRAVSEGNMPPDRLKSMQRELEKHLNGGQALKDLRIESILGLQDRLDWQKVARDFGVALPGKRTSQVEPVDKDNKIKTPTKADGGGFVDPSRESKADRARRKDDHDSADEFSPSGRRRRKRSRSPASPGKHRYRSRSRSPRRSPPPRRSRSPVRRRGRSYSRSPPPLRRRTPPPFRRAGEVKREGDERREENEPVMFLKPQALLPTPVELANGFVAPENSFMIFPPGSALPDPALLRPPPYPQVGIPAFAPTLPDIPIHQQQFILQQLQLAQIPNLAAQPLTNTWPPPSDVRHVLINPVPPLVFDQPPQQQQQQQQQQLQQQVVKNSEKYDPLRPSSPPNVDVEVEAASTPPKAAEPEAVASTADGSKDTGKAKKTTDKEKEKEKEKENDETSKTNEKRALKIVRNTVADFVKELLNPKWRDGVLSKDDFKVIAQKAVNKVVGNLQGSQIPKGPDRLERFMTSSKEKITKLVQEYVEKHTKNAPVPVSASVPA